MGTTAEGDAGESPARNWQRGATRRAILDAARLLAARQNSTDFSLNNVAKEAGYSTTTVFAYFQTKSELFNAIVADDLAAIARQMRDSYFPARPETQITPKPAPACEAPVSEAAETVIVPEPVSSTVVAFPAEPQPEERAEQAPGADAWLERRLRVFEKTLADHEARIAIAQTCSARAISVVDETTKAFGARLDASEKRTSKLSNDLTTRLSAAEKRLRENHGELRDKLLGVSQRIDALEVPARNTAVHTGYIAPAAVEEPQMVEEAPPAGKPLAPAAETYLSAARRVAQTAAALAEMEKSPRKKRAKNLWSRRAMAVLAMCTGGIFILGALIAFALGEHAGRSTPIRAISTRSAGHVLKLASISVGSARSVSK